MEEVTVTDQLVVLDTGMIEMMDAVAAAEEMPMTEDDVKKILEETEGTKTENEEDLHTPEEKKAKKNSWNDVEK